jgi:hypothetical protein
MFIDAGEYFLINLNFKSSFPNNLFILLYLINEKYILKIIYKNLAWHINLRFYPGSCSIYCTEIKVLKIDFIIVIKFF